MIESTEVEKFIGIRENITLQLGEILTSFDVSSLCPSVPIPPTLAYLGDLLRMNNFNQFEIKEFLTLTNLCMRQNNFHLEDGFDDQKEGTAIGNPSQQICS